MICSFDSNGNVRTCKNLYKLRLQRIFGFNAGIEIKRVTAADNGKYFVQVVFFQEVPFQEWRKNSTEVLVEVKSPGCM